MPPLQAQLRLESEFDLTDALYQGGVAVKDLSAGTCPVLSGELRDSHEVLIAGRNHVTVYVAADHASYVEQGTRFMEAQPYLGPALDIILPELMADLGRQEAAMEAERRRQQGNPLGSGILGGIAAIVAAELLRRALIKAGLVQDPEQEQVQ